MTLTDPITFVVDAPPEGKGRARSFRSKGSIGHYTPITTRSYESLIRHYASQEMKGREPTIRPVSMTLTAVFEIPKSWAKAKRAMALNNNFHPMVKPDIDNIAKVFSDAMNHVVYKDDSQIVYSVCAKVYGIEPKVVVTIKPL